MRATLLLLLVAATAGCVGEIEDPNGPGTSGPGGGSAGTGSVNHALCAAGPAPLRRLTNVEYDNTVRDLLGDTSAPASAFPPDENLYGFAAGASVSPLVAELYMNAAESLSASAVGKLDTLLPCKPADIGDAECAKKFIADFGKRAFRRPLTTEESDGFFALYENERKLEPFDASIELVITAMLQSPEFLYRPELGAGAADSKAKMVRLSSYEVANRLSYFLWQTMPDEELFSLADQDKLEDPVVIADQARRMLADDRSHDGILNFFTQFFRLAELPNSTKSDTLYPSFDSGLATAMAQETKRFVTEVLWNGDGRLGTLLTADWTMANGELAGLYGASGASGSEFVRVSLDPNQRAGLLTHAGLLSVLSGAEDSSPVYRGVFVREMLLCQTLPPPPESLNVMPPDPDPGLTTRERYDQHTSDPMCAQCHTKIDPIGFGFEHYDAIGRYRTKENGLPIDASGELTETDDADGPFVGVRELAGKLAASNQVQACMTKQFFRFALGRLDTDADACSLEEANKAFMSADGDLRELIVALVQTDSFRHRPVIEGGN